ncbi:4Fe-4S binding protein [bacterium]|nr:4Fe-4S binding protein [bacterium]MBU1638737.1 4Fe-4S binding protein [bacterium]MBU1919708.1 4Fe-4S binding protein [bacterium]
MKVLVVNEEKCTASGVCETVCSEYWFKEANKEKSRIQLMLRPDGHSLNVCNQCGECILVCPTEALYRDKKGIVRLREKDCTGCMSCVGFCPTQSMFVAVGEEIPFKCISCAQCVESCPSGALSIEDLPEPVERVFYREHL